MAKRITMIFAHVRTTKNFEVYHEAVEKPGDAVSILHLSKEHAHTLGYPHRVEYTIDEDGEAAIRTE